MAQSRLVPAPYHVFVHLLEQGATIVAQQDYPVGPERWAGKRSGEILVETTLIDTSALPPGNYILGVGLYDAATSERISVAYQTGEPVENNWIRLTRHLDWTGCPTSSTPCSNWQPAGVRFADQLEFTGVNLVYGAHSVAFDLQWRTLTQMQDLYRVFFHVVDQEGELVVQFDRQLGSSSAAAQGVSGEEMMDQVVIDLDSLPVGEYQVGVGVYDAVSEERLSAVGMNGAAVPENWFALPVRLKVEQPG